MKNYTAKIMKAIKQHEELLNKELAYSKDLQNDEAISHHSANIEKVKKMLSAESYAEYLATKARVASV